MTVSICFLFQDKTLKFYCEFNTQLDEDFSHPEDDNAAAEMLNIINVSVVDTPDKEKTVYCAETENMDSVSIKTRSFIWY